jgi:small-conductance mechanosensitive channel
VVFLHYLADGILRSLPGLGMVLVILILTRVAARALDAFFTSVADGTLEINWMQPETAQATRRIAGIVLWLFAITVAYPYVPGSSSDAFKGVSVFAGLLLTLGSAGMVNQMMSGLVVVYSRMMKPGDLVKVGEVTGRVSELGFLSTKVRTPTGHEVTLPNAILTGTSVSNFSRFDPATGPVISTTVTIGYDTPWRQVHALLELAASRTAGVERTAKPEILQTALSDFYVEYQMRCRIERVEDRLRTLSALHAQIQDAFNEFGVQIMSPHFEAQPAQNVLVPPGKHAPAPALPD